MEVDFMKLAESCARAWCKNRCQNNVFRDYDEAKSICLLAIATVARTCLDQSNFERFARRKAKCMLIDSYRHEQSRRRTESVWAARKKTVCRNETMDVLEGIEGTDRAILECRMDRIGDRETSRILGMKINKLRRHRSALISRLRCQW